jgi:glycosyltransferase involved in cell wall biosynthesis
LTDSSLPLVTIAIPTYNRAGSYLKLAVKSALAQTYPHIEVLVSDNASTDDTPALMQSLADPRLKYTRHQTNIGANQNANYCLDQAKGDYFLLLHDDDLIDPDFVSSCMEAANYSTKVGLIRTGVRVIDERGNVLGKSRNTASGLPPADFFRQWFSSKSSWYMVNTLFNTVQLRQHGGFQSTYQLSEDGFAIAHLACLNRVDIADVKASFRVHTGSLTFADPTLVLKWGKEYLNLLDYICELVPPEDRPLVRKDGMRFVARLTYNRAAIIRSPIRRVKMYYEICRSFHYRYLPSDHVKSLRLIRRIAGYARRRVTEVFNYG